MASQHAARCLRPNCGSCIQPEEHSCSLWSSLCIAQSSTVLLSQCVSFSLIGVGRGTPHVFDTSVQTQVHATTQTADSTPSTFVTKPRQSSLGPFPFCIQTPPNFAAAPAPSPPSPTLSPGLDQDKDAGVGPVPDNLQEQQQQQQQQQPHEQQQLQRKDCQLEPQPTLTPPNFPCVKYIAAAPLLFQQLAAGPATSSHSLQTVIPGAASKACVMEGTLPTSYSPATDACKGGGSSAACGATSMEASAECSSLAKEEEWEAGVAEGLGAGLLTFATMKHKVTCHAEEGYGGSNVQVACGFTGRARGLCMAGGGGSDDNLGMKPAHNQALRSAAEAIGAEDSSRTNASEVSLSPVGMAESLSAHNSGGLQAGGAAAGTGIAAEPSWVDAQAAEPHTTSIADVVEPAGAKARKGPMGPDSERGAFNYKHSTTVCGASGELMSEKSGGKRRSSGFRLSFLGGLFGGGEAGPQSRGARKSSSSHSSHSREGLSSSDSKHGLERGGSLNRRHA
eukprot:1148777-Pelagomonas_calceolata.AAC.3